MVIGVGKVDVSRGIKCNADPFSKHRVGCLPSIAAISQDSGTSDYGYAAISYPDFADEAAPVCYVNIASLVHSDARGVI
jgi:hypothetical protein